MNDQEGKIGVVWSCENMEKSEVVSSSENIFVSTMETKMQGK